MPAPTLIVLRHAKSSWDFVEPDHERPLAERGHREGMLAGQVLAEYEIDTVRCSTSVRTRQTWKRAQRGGATSRDVQFDPDLYDATPSDLYALVRTLPKSVRTALIIGHDTALTGFVLSLARPSGKRARVQEKFPTSAIAVLKLDGGWSKVSPGRAILDRYVIPR